MAQEPTKRGEIILVDDEDLILKLGRKVLEQLGYVVHQTDDTTLALDTLRRRIDNVSLAILDVVMPGIEGSDLATLMRRIKPDLKILFSSGYGITDEIQRQMRAGNTDFIAKPFTREDIVAKVSKLLSE
ncbi:MAG: response regulator [Myxococcales bacterium]|nr:MAG: response regulator [Myxococcales bacterium]